MNRTDRVRLAALALSLSAGLPAWADDKALPADQVIAAITAAVAAYPGQVHEVEVKDEKKRLIVEVSIVGEGKRKRDVKVDASTREVLTK